jgi:Protein of unknown function (DUF3199)
MFVTPDEVKAYSGAFPVVMSRDDDLVEKDILEAELDIKKQLGRPLTELEGALPEVQLAIQKLAQFYALINSDESIVKGYQSEKLGDYSYTLASGESIRKPDISNLLDDLLPVVNVTQKTRLRMRGI